MKLYVTHYSPYARMARIMLREKDLTARIEEVVAQTRQVDSPYYAINPSGRVPYLVRDGEAGLEESYLICDYLDQLDGAPQFQRPTGDDRWETLRLEALGRSLMDGVSVWIRELLRLKVDRSQAIIDHEIARSNRLLQSWEAEIEAPVMTGPFNYAQMYLACALDLELWNPRFTWRASSPKLNNWLGRVEARPSFVQTVPPGPLSDL